jgi:hypothetical protein
MEMRSVFESFAALCDNPVAWVVIGLVAAKTAHSAFYYFVCPFARGKVGVDAKQAEAMVQRRVLHDPRFLALMVLGIALAVGGLYALPSHDYGALGLAAVVLGSFVLVVEPSQLSINENQLRVAAASCAKGEAMELAVDRLRASHRERIVLETGLTAVLAAVVLIY